MSQLSIIVKITHEIYTSFIDMFGWITLICSNSFSACVFASSVALIVSFSSSIFWYLDLSWSIPLDDTVSSFSARVCRKYRSADKFCTRSKALERSANALWTAAIVSMYSWIMPCKSKEYIKIKRKKSYPNSIWPNKYSFTQVTPLTRCFTIPAFNFVCDLLTLTTAFAKLLISAARLFWESLVAFSFSNLASLMNDIPKRPVVALRSS